MKGKRVIVTGGMGFIGSNLADYLARDNEVLVIDDLSTGRRENLGNCEQGTITFVEGSLTKLDLPRLFQGYDYVFHQAALPSVPRSITDPVGSNEANVTGTVKVLTAAKDSGIKKVIFASSSSVYGDSKVMPKVETMPLNPLSPYAASKAACELYSKVFQEIYGLPTVALRYFNVFGPRQDPNSQYAAVIPKFITAIMQGRSPTVYGDGEQSRDFSYIKHVVRANVLAAETGMAGVYNIACGRSITINQLVLMLNDILGTAVKPVYQDPLKGDIKHSLADISKARAFGYDPAGNFQDELRETVEWFSSCHS
jgi:UDP-glucose 4-epimerase